MKSGVWSETYVFVFYGFIEYAIDILVCCILSSLYFELV